MRNKVCASLPVLLLVSFSFCVAQSAAKPATSGKQMLPYSIQVERVDAKVDGVPAAFSAAIYENLISELTKSGRYQQVLRDGDKRADSTGNLVKLKTTVQKFEEGSETKRAVTTVSGATKVFVHMQAVGSDGKVLMEKDVEGAVHFIGTNLRATLNLANSMVKQLDAGLSAPLTAKK
jgi:hypothetical protein